MLSAFTVLSLGSARRESATFDEPLHVLSGVAAWKTGQTNLDYSNPPLAVYWQTLPLLALRFDPFPPAAQLFEIKRTFSFAFVHHNHYSLAWMLQVPRAMNWVLGLLLGWVLFSWAKEALQPRAAKAALLAYAFCPMLLGYSHLATGDIGGALGWVLTLWMAWRWKQTPNAYRALQVGLALGLALCFKYSTVLVIPAVAAALALDAPRALRTHSIALIVLGALGVMMVCFHGWGLTNWIAGFSQFAVDFKEGHLNFFWGHYNRTGWKSYFLALFLLKTPVPFLAVLGWGLIARRRLNPKHLQFLWVWCLSPLALIFLVSSLSTIQVGIRHILPVYPFLCLWIGAAASTLPAPWTLFLGTWYVVGAVATYPRYLSYFNEFVTPSANAYPYFVDSNLDWGQGLKELGTYLRARGSPPIYLSYFGCGDPTSYGIAYQPVLMTACTELRGSGMETAQTPSLFAISATNRVGLYYDPHSVFSWLEGRKPVRTFMDSIWLYDLTNDPEARSRLHDLIARQ